MNDLTQRCLAAFPTWLASLGEDAAALATLLSAESLPDATRRYVAGALSYLHKSLDLIPDGVEDLGYLDDAFVLRVACRLALQDSPEAKEIDIRGIIARLADDASLIEQLLDKDHTRLADYVRGLRRGAARGRTVDEIVADPNVRADFVREISSWAKDYTPPSFANDDKNIVKLKGFLAAKLP